MNVIKVLSVAMSLTVLTLVGAPEVWAQDTLVGKYSGTYDTGSGVSRGMDVTITSIENENVKGTLSTYTRTGKCNGVRPFEGSYKEKQFVLTSKGVPVAGCSITLRLVSEGNKLTGTTDHGRRVELSK